MSNGIIGRYGMGMRNCCDSVAEVGVKHIEGCEFAKYPDKSISGVLGPYAIEMNAPDKKIIHKENN